MLAELTPRTAVVSALEVLRERPSGLVTDIDGTISRIVPRPDDATVEQGVREALERIAKSVAVIAVVTARDAATARRMVGASEVTYIGHYGLDSDAPESEDRALDSVKPMVRWLLGSLPGATFEDKEITFSVHYRNCPEPDTARRLLLEALAPIALQAGGRLLEGKRVIEVVPASLPDKLSAVSRLVAANNLRGLVYLGDDVSDVAVFREIARRRTEEQLPGLAVAVIDRESDPSVVDNGDVRLDGVGGAVEFLRRLADGLESKGEVANA